MISSCLLLAGCLADDLFADAAGTGQFVLGQFVDDFHTWQVGWQRLALAATLDRRDDFFGFAWNGGRLVDQLFGLVEHGQLRCAASSGLRSDLSEKSLCRSRATCSWS